jgi:hypothetical protein
MADMKLVASAVMTALIVGAGCPVPAMLTPFLSLSNTRLP